MSVITDGQHHWVDERALAWLAHTNKQQPTDLSGFPRESSRVSSAINQRRPKDIPSHRKGFIFYELVDKNSRVQEELCNLSPSPRQEPRLLSQLRSIFCGTRSTVSDSDVAKLRIVLVKDDQSDDLLACAENNNTVKIHFEEARYEFPDMFGKPSIIVGPVAAPVHNGVAVVCTKWDTGSDYLI